jgi:hypothetical protein
MINTYKVSLSVGKTQVIFEASTPISESRTANYDGHNIIHLPTDILTYKNTSGRNFGVTAKLVSRNSDEATANSRIVDLIRSWVLPDFGKTGATPPIVKLSAFYNKNIKNVPCIIKNYSINYPDDVDWIFGLDSLEDRNPMPVVTTITLTLEESYSALQVTKKAWKMKITNANGSNFVYGENYKDITSAGGGAQTIDNTPGLIDLSSSSNFTGIASQDYLGNINQPTTFGNGNLTNAYGVASSPLISQQPNISSPFIDGFNPNNVAQLTDQRTQPALPSIIPVTKTFTINTIKPAT